METNDPTDQVEKEIKEEDDQECSTSTAIHHPSKFRSCSQIGFFDRATYLRNTPRFYKWRADLDSITSAGNFLRFDIYRDYEDSFKTLAAGKDIDVRLHVTCQRIFTSHNISDEWEDNQNIPDESKIAYQNSKFGVFNILIEEPENTEY